VRQGLPLTALTTLVGPTRLKLRELRQRVHHVCWETIRDAQSRLQGVHAHIQAANPDRYFALGLSYVTRPDGTVVRHCAEVGPGDVIEVHLKDGTVPATVKRKDGL
jgi:exonuclease VII large subunit